MSATSSRRDFVFSSGRFWSIQSAKRSRASEYAFRSGPGFDTTTRSASNVFTPSSRARSRAVRSGRSSAAAVGAPARRVRAVNIKTRRRGMRSVCDWQAMTRLYVDKGCSMSKVARGGKRVREGHRIRAGRVRSSLCGGKGLQSGTSADCSSRCRQCAHRGVPGDFRMPLHPRRCCRCRSRSC